MNILETLLASARGGALGRAAETRGLGTNDVQALLGQLVPALTVQMTRNASEDDGRGLASALGRGNHARYLDDGATLASPEAVDDGNGILGHILGSKDASRALAARAASNTGIDVGTIKQFLPVVAAATMGAMSKGTNGGQSGLGGLLSQFLDSNRDGSVAGDLLSLGKKFLR